MRHRRSSGPQCQFTCRCKAFTAGVHAGRGDPLDIAVRLYQPPVVLQLHCCGTPEVQSADCECGVRLLWDCRSALSIALRAGTGWGGARAGAEAAPAGPHQLPSSEAEARLSGAPDILQACALVLRQCSKSKPALRCRLHTERLDCHGRTTGRFLSE